jgi:hypothetical protein
LSFFSKWGFFFRVRVRVGVVVMVRDGFVVRVIVRVRVKVRVSVRDRVSFEISVFEFLLSVEHFLSLTPSLSSYYL